MLTALMQQAATMVRASSCNSQTCTCTAAHAAHLLCVIIFRQGKPTSGWLQAIQRLATHPKLAARVYAVPAGAHVGASQLTRMGSGASASSQVVPVPAGVRDQRFAQEQASEMAQLPLRVPAKGARGPLAMEPVVRPQ